MKADPPVKLNDIPIGSLQAFEAAARYLSFQKAAAEIGISPSTLTYRIGQLEKHLGKKLFVRRNRAVALTAEGRAIEPYVMAGIQNLIGAFAFVEPNDDENTLRIGIDRSLSTTWLAPRISAFMDRYPEVHLQILYNPESIRFIETDVDVIVQPDADDGAESISIFQEYALPVISPAHFEALGGVADGGLFDKAVLLHNRSEDRIVNASWSHWAEGGGFEFDVRPGIRFSNADLALNAAANHCGITVARTTYCLRLLESGALIAPFDHVIQLDPVFALRYPRERAGERLIGDFREWLLEEAEAHDEKTRRFLSGKAVADLRL